MVLRHNRGTKIANESLPVAKAKFYTFLPFFASIQIMSPLCMGKFLIVGLGNIGVEYAGTRHNIGFDVLDAFVTGRDVRFSVERLAEKVEVKWHGHIMVCIKPTTYMN